jgi:ribosomal-protein-alanine N-acetyltransferase
VWRDDEFYCLKSDRVHLEEDFRIVAIHFEVLVNDIRAQFLPVMTSLLIPELITTQRLVIRRLRYEDADEIFYTYASKPEATQYVAWPMHKKIADTRAYLGYAVPAWEQGRDFSFSIRLADHNRFIGTFGFMNDSGKIQFGYALGPLYWSQGYATEACTKMMSMIRSVPGVFRVGTLVDIENVASSKVLLKAGLVEEARLPKWMRFVNQGNEPKDCILYRLPM